MLDFQILNSLFEVLAVALMDRWAFEPDGGPVDGLGGFGRYDLAGLVEDDGGVKIFEFSCRCEVS